MNSKLAGFALFLVVLVFGPPAHAGGDWAGPAGYRNYGAAVPVPAPIPVPVYAAEWYLRLDAGIGFGASPNVSSTGAPLGIPSATEEPFGYAPAWFNKDFDTFFTGGGGVGYRWSPNLRTDVTIDYNSSGDAEVSRTAVYEVVTGGVPSGDFSQVVVNDKTSLNSVLFMLNGYIDFTPWRGITPYVGAGVGFALNSINRTHNSTDYVCDDAVCANPSGPIDTFARGNNYDVSFAAAVMAGISYDFTPTTSLDLSYRYLHIGGSDISLGVNGVPTKISIGDFNEHQLRAGLRFNVF